jgi:hypothetical protein
MSAVATVLELHMKALEQSDANSRKEYEVYQRLVMAHRELASRLEATGREMAGYRDLPMGRHDPKAMAAAENARAFETFVRVEEKLIALLQRRLEGDRAMLQQMSRSS